MAQSGCQRYDWRCRGGEYLGYITGIERQIAIREAERAAAETRRIVAKQAPCDPPNNPIAAIMPPEHHGSERTSHQEGNDMRSLVRAGLAALTITELCGATAHAQLRIYHHMGAWDAFSGRGSDGRTVCGVGTTNPTDNRGMSIRFMIGGEDVLFEVKKPTWSIPAGTKLVVVMQVGPNVPWTEQASGDGQTISWTMDRGTMLAFDQQFRTAGSMTLGFPTGNEPPWSMSLTGSMAISNAFGRCVADLTAQQAPPPAPAAPTQPYAPVPGQPAPASDGTQPTPGPPPSR